MLTTKECHSVLQCLPLPTPHGLAILCSCSLSVVQLCSPLPCIVQMQPCLLFVFIGNRVLKQKRCQTGENMFVFTLFQCIVQQLQTAVSSSKYSQVDIPFPFLRGLGFGATFVLLQTNLLVLFLPPNSH